MVSDQKTLLIKTHCCGVGAIQYLDWSDTPLDIWLAIRDTLRYHHFSFVWFYGTPLRNRSTDHGKDRPDDIAHKFWEFIREHKLGQVQWSNAIVNPKTTNKLRMYVWQVDWVGVFAHKPWSDSHPQAPGGVSPSWWERVTRQQMLFTLDRPLAESRPGEPISVTHMYYSPDDLRPGTELGDIIPHDAMPWPIIDHTTVVSSSLPEEGRVIAPGRSFVAYIDRIHNHNQLVPCDARPVKSHPQAPPPGGDGWDHF